MQCSCQSTPDTEIKQSIPTSLQCAYDWLQDTLARFKKTHKDMKELPSKACFQMNDTHPTIAVAELMRLLIDQEGLQWEAAWDITTKVC